MVRKWTHHATQGEPYKEQRGAGKWSASLGNSLEQLVTINAGPKLGACLPFASLEERN